MNPLFNNDAQNIIKLLQSVNGNPNQLANQIMNSNPKFANIIRSASSQNELKNLCIQELQRRGIDLNTLRSMGIPF